MATRVAVETEKAVREHAAAEEGAKLLLDEAGSGLGSALRASEEALQLAANDLVKEALLRLVALGLGHEVASPDRRGRRQSPRGVEASVRLVLPVNVNWQICRFVESGARASTQ